MEDATLSLLHCHWAPFRCRRQQLPYLVLPGDICHLPSQPVTSASKMTPHLTLRHVILLFASLLHLSLLGASANCTANCLHSSRREWPTFDFDFYYEHSGDGPPPTSQPESTVISYSIYPSIINPSPSSSPSLSPSPSTSFSAADSHTSTSAATNLSLSTAIHPTPSTVAPPSPQSITIRPTPSLPDASLNTNGSNTPCESEHSQLRNTSTSQANLTSQSWPLEGYLLRSVFRNTPNHSNESSPNLSNHFATALQTIYEHALAKQKAEMSHRMRRHLLAAVNETSDHFNLTIWDLQVDDSLSTIDVIYYLQKDGVLVPYEDALKVMSFAAPELFASQTGYAVIHKVRRYNEDWSSAPQSASFNWLNLTFLLALLLVLLFCVALIGYLYLKYRREKRRWLESINKELNRVKPSGAKDGSHWNYGQDEDEDDEEDDDDQGDSSAYGTTPRPSTSHQSGEKEDKSSQYDYATYQRREAASGPDPNVSGLPPTPLYRERLIPIGSGSTGEYDAGYDRISYIRTQETVKETKRTPNILEVQLSKETQSIVKEIRNELNRYNFKKILTTEPADLTTSDA